MIKFVIDDNYEELSRKAASMIAAQVIEKPDSVLGLATGSSPIGVYEKLVELNEKNWIDFSQVKTFNLDEYVGLDGQNEQSYRYFMDVNLFDKVSIDKKNTLVLNGKAENLEAECSSYDNLLDERGPLDIQLLGIGENGHIGFNEPDSQFVLDTHVVDLAESTIKANSRLFEDIKDVPCQALTMGIRHIMKAKKIILIATGSKKAEAVKKAFWGPVTPEVPASILQLHPNVVVFADLAATLLIEERDLV